MRIALLVGPVVAVATTLAAGCAQLTQDGTTTSSSAATADGGADADAGIVGAGCGIESGSGQLLCAATSVCPKVVVDTDALPHCGFRVKGTTPELVCACGESICSMGAYTTCAQAAALLKSQSEAAVCTQVAEQRCSAAAARATGASSSGSSGSTCDHSCLQECGQGAGCASICGC